jgi:hypothetical protein
MKFIAELPEEEMSSTVSKLIGFIQQQAEELQALNPFFRVEIKILYKYTEFHFLNGCYGTTFVHCFLDRLTRVKTYSQGRINFLLSWLRPSAFSYMHHITIFTVHRDSDSILACQLLPQT